MLRDFWDFIREIISFQPRWYARLKYQKRMAYTRQREQFRLNRTRFFWHGKRPVVGKMPKKRRRNWG